jgi:hypothetical protein
MQNQSENLADNIPDNVQNFLPDAADNTPDSDVCPADNLADDRQNNDIFSKISILELQKKYEIGRDPLYARMRYLQIKTWKIGKKAYLDAGQIVQMDSLHEHIKATGRMEGYPVPEPSGPQDEQTDTPETTTAITTVSSANEIQETQQLDTKPDYSTGQRQHQNSEMEAIAALVRSAQGKAAGFIIAENILTKQYLENPDTLPEELKAKIEESARIPEIDPFAYANALTNFAQKATSGVDNAKVSGVAV